MRILALASLLALAAGQASAEETRQLPPHEHGMAKVDIAIEGNVVSLDLRAPGADVTGFGHRAESDEDREAVRQAFAILGSPLDLVVPPAAAGCVVDSADIEIERHTAEAHDHDEHDADEDHHEEAHEEHAEEEHAEEEHAHDEAGGEHANGETGHSDFHGAYTFVCSDPQALDSFELAWFDSFRKTQRIAVQIIADTGAHAFEATPQARKVDIAGHL